MKQNEFRKMKIKMPVDLNIIFSYEMGIKIDKTFSINNPR